MLAGKIKLSTFLVVAGVVGVALCGGGGWWASQAWEAAEAERIAEELKFEKELAERLAREAAEAAAAAAIAAPTATSAGREVDGVIFSYLGKPIASEKLKDVSEGMVFKVNIYKDAGQMVANRAKVDLDRDEKWDETITWSDGAVTREHSPNDDENYTERSTWDGAIWVGEGAVVSPSTAASAAAPTVIGANAEREADRVALSYIGKDIGTDKLKDITKGKPFKVNVYQDAGSATANRAKLDLDRDDKWDEKLTFEPEKITREVAPADDENYTETWHWDGAGWVKA